jgi:kynurenine formamidase
MPLTEALRELSARVSNWGRWGDDDERGTLNLITAEAVRRGVAAVRNGRPFSLAIPFDADGPQWDNVNMPLRTNPALNTYAVNVSFTGNTADFTTSDDAFAMGSQAATHWDGLAHVGYEGRLYNGLDDRVITAEAGATRLGVENIGPVVTRGILLDIAALHGVDHFDDNYAITADDLDRAVATARVEVQPGDAVLIHTGHMHWLRMGKRERYSHPSPGLSTSTIAWVRDHDIAAIATDTLTFEVYPCEDPAVFMPVHMLHLRDIGVLQGQVWNLDALAADCAADGQYDFLLCATPLPLTGAVGAPVAPTAVK